MRFETPEAGEEIEWKELNVSYNYGVRALSAHPGAAGLGVVRDGRKVYSPEERPDRFERELPEKVRRLAGARDYGLRRL